MRTVLFILCVFCTQSLIAQQIADSSYNPPVREPAYPAGTGPVVLIDEGHYNFHTKDGRYQSFAHLLERDGYVVKSHTGSFAEESLEGSRILVISNALNAQNVGAWYVPTPSAFTDTEISVLKEWVYQGGSLFLIADHMPFAGAATELAQVFGFACTNGFIMDTTTQGPIYFSHADKTLSEDIVTNGRTSSEKVTHVATFTGQGFNLPPEAVSVLRLNAHCINLVPDTAWVFDNTPALPARDMSQLAYRRFGEGRIVLSGEAAMFSAQLAGPNRMKFGMNSDDAQQNYQLLLNLIHWLDGLID